MVVEAVFEDRAIKAEVTRKLDAVLPPGCVLASNTSALPITLAQASDRPDRFIGLHFFGRQGDAAGGSHSRQADIGCHAGAGTGFRGSAQEDAHCRQRQARLFHQPLHRRLWMTPSAWWQKALPLH
jgi:hypothetical protein